MSSQTFDLRPECTDNKCKEALKCSPVHLLEKRHSWCPFSSCMIDCKTCITKSTFDPRSYCTDLTCSETSKCPKEHLLEKKHLWCLVSCCVVDCEICIGKIN